MSEFNVGDKVRVKCTGEGFSTYINFFKENNLTQFVPRYHEDISISVGDYKVVGKGKHHLGCYGTVYVLEGSAGNIFLIGNDRGDSIELIKEEPKMIYASDLMTEARKNPEKYEGKRYKAKSLAIDSQGNGLYNLTVRSGRVVCEDERSLRVYITEDTQLEEIKPEPKPVNVLDAMRARIVERKTLRCVSCGVERTYKCNSTGLEDQNLNPVSANEILNGQWYIEE